jgi:hypothetical protein
MKTYKYTDATNTVVHVIDGDGVSRQSGLASVVVPEGAAIGPADSITPAVPAVVTMRQARLALLQTGMLAQVNAAVAAADDATKITWEFSSEVQRGNPLVSTLTAVLSLSDQQIDDLFSLSATL